MRLPTLPPRPRRRWWQPSLATWMVVVLAVGGVSGWMAHVTRTQRAALVALRAVQANVWFDDEDEPTLVPGSNPPIYRGGPSAPHWLRRWLGDELFQSVASVEMVAPSDEATWRHLAELRGLTSLSLFWSESRGRDLDQLRDLRHLTSITFEGPGLLDRDLAALARLRRVDSLDLRTVRASDAGFAALGSMDGITLAWFSDCPNLSDATLARLVAGWPCLQRFVVRGEGPAQLTATVAALAAHCPDLRELEMTGPRTGNDDLALIARLTGLTCLDLSGSLITDEGMVRLRPLVRLQTARFGRTAVTDQALIVIGGWPDLNFLDLRGTAVVGPGLTHLASRPIDWLDLDGTRLTDAHLPLLRAIRTLSHADLSNLPGVTDAGVAALNPGFAIRRVGVPTAVPTTPHSEPPQ